VESRMMVQASTLPNWEKYFLSDSSVVSQFSPPMNILLNVRVIQSTIVV